MTTPRALAAAAFTAAAALAAWAGWVRPRRVVIRRIEIAPPGWPRALDGLRIALVSDLHAGAPHVDSGKVARIVGRVNRERPDLVVLLGDYVDPELPLGGHVPVELVAGALGALSAPLGIVAILGNHDLAYGADRARAALGTRGIQLLDGDATVVERSGVRLGLVGLEARDSSEPAGGPLELPECDAAVVLSHSPDAFPRVPRAAALTLAGHTHGAQVDLPLVRELVVPSRYGTRYKAGLVEEDDGRLLFVGAGIGTSRLPLRLGAPPEVPILSLRAESESRAPGSRRPGVG